MLVVDAPLLVSHSPPWFGLVWCQHSIALFTVETCSIQLAHWPTGSKVIAGAWWEPTKGTSSACGRQVLGN